MRILRVAAGPWRVLSVAAGGMRDIRGGRGRIGYTGWSPVYALAVDGTPGDPDARYVTRLADWVGGEGAKPPTTDDGDPLYVGPDGYTTVIADAIDIRGAPGSQNVTAAFYAQGQFLPNDLLGQYLFTEAWTIDPSRCGARCRVPPTAQVICRILYDGDQIGTATFAASSLIGVCAFTTTDLPPGLLSGLAPALIDATIADISITVSGER